MRRATSGDAFNAALNSTEAESAPVQSSNEPDRRMDRAARLRINQGEATNKKLSHPYSHQRELHVCREANASHCAAMLHGGCISVASLFNAAVRRFL